MVISRPSFFGGMWLRVHRLGTLSGTGALKEVIVPKREMFSLGVSSTEG